MSDREFFIETIKDELPRFKRVFAAVPAKRLNYRPHPTSRSAAELLEVFLLDAVSFLPFLKTGSIDFLKVKTKTITNPVAIGQAFEKELKAVLKLVAKQTNEDWDSIAQMLAGKKVEWETTKGKMAWGLLLDLIHHRGQLSTYLRPMGGIVPAIYGPSGDSK